MTIMFILTWWQSWKLIYPWQGITLIWKYQEVEGMRKFSKSNYFRIFLNKTLQKTFYLKKVNANLKRLIIFCSWFLVSWSAFFKKVKCLLYCIERDLHNSNFSRHYGRWRKDWLLTMGSLFGQPGGSIFSFAMVTFLYTLNFIDSNTELARKALI